MRYMPHYSNIWYRKYMVYIIFYIKALNKIQKNKLEHFYLISVSPLRIFVRIFYITSICKYILI